MERGRGEGWPGEESSNPDKWSQARPSSFPYICTPTSLPPSLFPRGPGLPAPLRSARGDLAFSTADSGPAAHAGDRRPPPAQSPSGSPRPTPLAGADRCAAGAVTPTGLTCVHVTACYPCVYLCKSSDTRGSTRVHFTLSFNRYYSLALTCHCFLALLRGLGWDGQHERDTRSGEAPRQLEPHT